VYEGELVNFEEHGDEGEIWFGEESVEKMVHWALQHVPPHTSPCILEVGSGNGTLLFALFESGYAADTMLGIDYSQDAVQLAQSIASTRGAAQITFDVCDFLKTDPPLLSTIDRTSSNGGWDLILDKGTYDAISLGEKDENGRSPAARYPEHVARLLQTGGQFLITSCNFTEDELKAHFATPSTGLIYNSRIQHPTFMFGGKSGSICASIAFQKPLL
jgi:SAM-dependent methyltransferase